MIWVNHRLPTALDVLNRKKEVLVKEGPDEIRKFKPWYSVKLGESWWLTKPLRTDQQELATHDTKQTDSVYSYHFPVVKQESLAKALNSLSHTLDGLEKQLHNVNLLLSQQHGR